MTMRNMFVVAVLWCLLPSTGYAQAPSPSGRVADPQGGAVIGAIRSRRHRINLRLENLFDEVYTTRHARGFPDSSSAPFLVHTLGVPRTFHMSYSFSY